MDARDEILKYLLEKKDNRRMIDITELVKSLGLEPIQLRSVLSEIKRKNLAEISSMIFDGNNLVNSTSILGSKSIANNKKYPISINDIHYIKGRINIEGELFMKENSTTNYNIKADNVIIGKEIRDINQSSSRKEATKYINSPTKNKRIKLFKQIGLLLSIIAAGIMIYEFIVKNFIIK